MKQYEIAIIGGGVAGYFAAILLLEKNPNTKIIILEKESQPMKKLLTTGSGACNFSHSGSVEDFLLRYGSNGQFLRNAFYNYFVDDIVSFFESNNISTFCRDDGKFFPLSMKAQQIKDLFLTLTKTIQTNCNEKVTHIEKHEDTFLINTVHSEYRACKILITTGGKSFPNTGSSGDGYSFAKSFGHSITPPKPSLASIFCATHPLSTLSGISFETVTLTHENNGKKKSYSGPLLITHKGFSGPVIIDNSRSFSIGDVLKISFIQDKVERIESQLRSLSNETMIGALKTYAIPKKMVQFFLDEESIPITKKIGEISHKHLQAIINRLVSFEVEITNIEDYNTCMCTAGGVSLKEINPKTFESKIVDGLYFLGEVIDIDGDSGGYNLQAIWSECALFAKNYYSF